MRTLFDRSMRAIWATLLILCSACDETIDESYATFGEAEAAGMARRGWLPVFVPRTATDIRAEHDLDTNEQWLRFRVPSGDTSVLVGAVPIHPALLAAVYRAPPRSLGEFPSALATRDAAVRGTDSVRYVRHRDPNGGALCVALHRMANLVYLWNCAAGAG